MPPHSPSALLSSLLLAVVLALVHGAVRFSGPQTSTGLSMVGGISIGYVMVRIFPNICLAQAITERTAKHGWIFLRERIYILVLAGLVAAYVLRKGRMAGRRRGSSPSGANYWLHIAGNATLSLLVGYLLIHRPPGAANAVVFCVAMASYFIRYDSGLRRDYGEVFDRNGRWILSAAVLAGWLVGLGTELPLEVVAGLFAFLAGAIILTTLREELPEEEDSKPWAFALGAAIITVLQTAAG